MTLPKVTIASLFLFSADPSVGCIPLDIVTLSILLLGIVFVLNAKFPGRVKFATPTVLPPESAFTPSLFFGDWNLCGLAFCNAILSDVFFFLLICGCLGSN